MAIGLVKLTENDRKNLLLILTILCFLQAILGGAITAPSLYVLVFISPIVSGESAEVQFVFATTGIFGTQVIFHWLVGIKLCKRCFNQAKKKSTRNLLLLWTCAGSHCVLNLIIIATLSRKLNKQIGRAMKNSLQSSMKNYLRDENIKMNLDNLQYYQQCCGVYSYTDWHVISWLTKYEVDVNSGTFKQYRRGDENMHLPVVPWSCCKLDFPMQCLHDPLQQQLFSHIWETEPSVVTSSMNTNGCLSVVWRPISLLLAIIALFMWIVVFLHIIIFCMARILYTSCRNLILLDDPHGISPGWIFGRGDCGYVRGKTLSQIMMDANQNQKSRSLSRLQASPGSTGKKLHSQSFCQSNCSETVNLVYGINRNKRRCPRIDETSQDSEKSSCPEFLNLK